MSATTHNSQRLGRLIPVRTTEDIEFLVKESEVITGRLGRKFVIASADRLVYLIQWHLDAYQVQRLDHHGYPICTLTMLPDEFEAHILGAALRAGQLFTSPANH
jgi:hypothetical protein